MKALIVNHVSGRTASGRVFSAGAGLECDIDDGDAEMVALMRAWAAVGDVEVLDEQPDQETPAEEPAVEGPPAEAKAKAPATPRTKAGKAAAE